jgi:hypothetical protein
LEAGTGACRGIFPPAGTGTSPRRDRDQPPSATRDGDGSPASSSSPSSGASSSSSRLNDLDDLDDAALASRALDALARGEEEATRAHSRLFAGGVALDESVAALAPYAREPGAIERVVTVRSARAKTNAPPPFAVLTPEEKLNLTRLLRRAAKHALANRSAAAARGEKNDDADGGAGATGAGEGRRRRRATFAVDFEDVVDARRHGGGGRARRRDADEAADEYSRADAVGSGWRLPRRTDANDDDAAASPGMKRTQPRRRAAAAAKKRWDPARDAFAFARELRAKLAEAKKRKENAARGERDRAPEGTRGREEAAAAGRERDFGGGEADSGEEEDPGGGSPPHEHEHEPAAASGGGGGDFSATSRRPLGAPPPPRRPASPPPVAWRSSTRVALATGLPLELFEDDDDACDARVLEAERGLRDARVATEASAEANAADTRKAAAENKSSTEEGRRNAVSNARRNEPNASAGNDDDVHAADEMTEEDAARLAALRREAAAKLSRRYDASVAAAYSSSRDRRLLPEKNREVVPPPMRFRDGFPSRPPKPGARAKAARYAGLWYAPIGARSAVGDAKARGIWADRATGTEKAERAREAAARREALDEACAGAYATRAYRKYLEETVDVERERVPAYVR